MNNKLKEVDFVINWNLHFICTTHCDLTRRQRLAYFKKKKKKNTLLQKVSIISVCDII